jgi:hypothetical protein
MLNTYDANPQLQLRELTDDEIEAVSGGWNAESMIRLCIEQNKPTLVISDVRINGVPIN